MRHLIPRPPAAALLALLLLAAAACGADTIFLHESSPRICLTSPDAQYVLNDGVLVPQGGMFSLYAPGEKPLEPRAIVPHLPNRGSFFGFTSSPRSPWNRSSSR